jgi:serine/threonine-protein kinase
VQESDVIAGKYRLTALLGRGGMGSVWRAQHLGLDAPVAIKLMDATLAASGEGRARFLREAQAAASLRSPHVVQVLDHGFDESTHQPFIVMELMEGESLATRLSRLGRLAPRDAARVLNHVARALTRAHASGIVHRDLKPDNVFLVQNEDEEIAKVLDFGIAKSQAHQLGQGAATQTGAVMGTPYYMSPEQIGGSRTVDFRTDLWALGVIACECLTGRRPFDADTIGGLVLKICAEKPQPASHFGAVPPGFDAWFERATARDVTLRFQSARELADEFKLVCDGAEHASAASQSSALQASSQSFGTASALSRSTGRFRSSDGPGNELEAPVKRSSARLVVGALALAALAVSLFIWFRREPQGPENLPIVSPATQPARPLPSTELVPAQAPPEPPAAASKLQVEPVASASAEPAAIVPPAARATRRTRPARPGSAPAADALPAKPSAPVRTGDVLDERR